ncbi:hypothetical protein [Hoeflea ulvae]|uniref:Glycosyltransferase n=1 Tax=Hoeflea ulvae TaxID=2983764 RepID=A0ABT3YM86_9HYPH|nr:hypothetical protein [Hoeflea ulvae]MCY0096899.1 hypothetical protein [Hoeflea ulvae]
MRPGDFSTHDWIGPASRTLPTTDLYFLNACRRWLGSRPFYPAPIRRVGANSFTCGDSIIVSRRDSPAVVERLLRKSCGQFCYIIDDDLWALDDDTSLPVAYRQRLITLRDGQHRRLTERADTIIVSSSVLADVYRDRGHRVVQLDPFWSEALADGSHFDPLADGAPLEVGYLGSSSHASDRGFVLQVFEELAARDLNLRLTIIGTADVPAHLRKHPKLQILKHLPWPLYRKRLARQRFHVLLYPSLPTAFNKARSFNKLIEHAVAGGVGIYSDSWNFAQDIEANKAGFLLENTVEHWADFLGAIDRTGLKASSNSTLAYTRELNLTSRSKQLEFWKKTLKLS